jgi:hypothetical protein
MKLVLALAALVLVAGCGEEEGEAPAAGPPRFADLSVTVDDGKGPKTVQVRCDAASDSRECAALAEMKRKTFEPVPANIACTQQYGGPETATVKGTLRGERVDARFSRVNGCEIARWSAARDLLAAAG